MEFSAGIRNATKLAASWLVAAGCMYASVAHYDELKDATAYMLGIDLPAIVAEARQSDETRDRVTEAEARARQAEIRAIEAEARVKQAEARAKTLQSMKAEASRARPIFTNTVALRAGSNGHYFANADLNGRSVDVLVDTGATMVALTYEDARRIGLGVSNSDFTGRTNTANGVARYAPVTIDSIRIGSITVQNVKGSVAEPGRLGVTLLGMSFLGRLSRAEIKSGVLELEE